MYAALVSQPAYRQHRLAQMLTSARAARPPLHRRAEDADDIDDILCSLWPTSTASEPSIPAPFSAAGPGLVHMGRGRGDSSCSSSNSSSSNGHSPASGHSTPPGPPSVAPYTLAAPSAPGQALDASRPLQQAAPLGRSVSASIQIGDPEWRVDSPQSIHGAAAKSPLFLPSMKLPLSDSHTVPAPPLAPSMLPPADSTGPAVRPSALLGLGLGANGTRGAQHSLRRATLGLLRSSNSSPGAVGVCRPAPSRTARMLTPEERVARLHTVSGLAARAVARRCLSGQIPALDADAMLRQTATSHSRPPPAIRMKPTFADVARASQDQS